MLPAVRVKIKQNILSFILNPIKHNINHSVSIYPLGIRPKRYRLLISEEILILTLNYRFNNNILKLEQDNLYVECIPHQLKS